MKKKLRPGEEIGLTQFHAATWYFCWGNVTQISPIAPAAICVVQVMRFLRDIRTGAAARSALSSTACSWSMPACSWANSRVWQGGELQDWWEAPQCGLQQCPPAVPPAPPPAPRQRAEPATAAARGSSSQAFSKFRTVINGYSVEMATRALAHKLAAGWSISLLRDRTSKISRLKYNVLHWNLTQRYT